MATTVTVSTEYANEALDAGNANMNGGKLDLRTGSPPASPDSAVTGTQLALLSLNATAFGAAASRVATANAIADVLGLAIGVAGYGRLTKADGTTGVMDIPAGGSWVITNVNTGTETITTNVAHGLSANDPVEVFAEAGATLPSPLAEDTTYYVRNPSGANLELSATVGGAAINLTTTGSGTFRLKRQTVGLALASSDGSVAAGVTVGVASLKVRM